MAGADVFPSQSDGILASFNVESVFFIENMVITKNLTDFCFFFFIIKTIVITENLTDFCKLVEAGGVPRPNGQAVI